jgi:hypothetical protein
MAVGIIAIILCMGWATARGRKKEKVDRDYGGENA